MKFIKRYILKNYISTFWFFFLVKNVLYNILDNILFFWFKGFLFLYLNIFYCKKIKASLLFLFFYKKHLKLLNLSFFIKQKLKINLYYNYLTTNYVLLLQGRGFKLLTSENSILTFKLGLTHNITLKIKKNITSKILTKNSQKIKITGNLLNLIQILACLNFIKKKNIFTSKGIFIINEKFKEKKSTKISW